MSTQTSGQGTTGVIHNIGYRHYDGPRLGRFDIIKAMYSATLRGSYGVGRGIVAKLFPWFLVGCTIIPAFVIVAVQAQFGEQVVEFHQYTIFVQMVPALFLAVQAPQAVSRDLRFNVIPLYFSRPLTAGDYVLAKFAGVWSGLYLLFIAPLLLLWVGALLIEQPFGETGLELLGALIGVALLATLLTGIGLLLASVTPRRGLGVAAIITVLTGSYAAASFIQGITSWSASPETAAWAGVLSPVTLYDGAQSGLFGYSPSSEAASLGVGGGLVFTALMLGFTALCYLLLLVRYRKVASS